MDSISDWMDGNKAKDKWIWIGESWMDSGRITKTFGFSALENGKIKE